MRYALYFPSTGEIDQIVEQSDTESAPPHSDQYNLMTLLTDVNPNTHKVDDTGPEPVIVAKSVDPDLGLATWVDIKQIRNRFEQYKVTTPHGTIDADNGSLKRLEDAKNNFLWLSPKVNGEVGWKMADNSIVYFSLLELTGLYEEAVKEKSCRTHLLHNKAEELRVMDPAPALLFIADIANWIP